MIGKKINSVENVPIFTVKEILKERLQTTEKGEETSYELNSANEYVKKFSKLTPAKGKKMFAELKALEGVSEELAIKITDILPETDVELQLLTPRNINLDDKTKSAILELVKKSQ